MWIWWKLEIKKDQWPKRTFQFANNYKILIWNECNRLMYFDK